MLQIFVIIVIIVIRMTSSRGCGARRLKMNKPAVASEMIDFLSVRVLAGTYAPGGRIPSVRSLMRKFNLSYGSALNGISYLCEIGLLEKHPKSGVSVSRNPCPPPVDNVRCVGILASTGHRPNPGLVYQALSEIQRGAIEHNYPLVSASGSFDSLFPILEQCRVVIVMTELDEEEHTLPFSAPAVGLFQADDYLGQMSIVDIDPWQTARIATDFFRNRRVKRVSVLTDPHAVYRQRGRLFELFWREAGGENGDFVVADYNHLEFRDFRPDEGYLFTSDHQLQHYAEFLRRETGTELTETCAVLGIDGKSLLVPGFERFPTIAADWREIGRIAFAEAIERMKNPRRPARRIYSPGKLIEPEIQT